MGYKGLHRLKGITKASRVTKSFKGYKRLETVTRGYKGLQEVTKGLQGVTEGYKW